MKCKSKHRSGKTTNKKRRGDETSSKLIVKQRTRRSRQFAGFKTIWR